MENCIFCKIVRGEIPSNKVYEDDLILAFRDIHPQRPVHVLVIPKKHVGSLMAVEANDAEAFGRILMKAGDIARAEGSADGFRLIINNGRVGGQEVDHLHAHIVGGPDPVGPMLKR